MIITSGFNVYPAEIENTLRMHPEVSDARLTGKEDLMRGEIVKGACHKKTGFLRQRKRYNETLQEIPLFL